MTREDFARKLREAAERYVIPLKREIAESLFVYYEELFIWNERINLISRAERVCFVERHLVDSLSALKLHIERDSAILDIGSGNGLPGIPLAVALPEVRIELLESREKRCAFLQHIISRLELTNAAVYCGRFEELYEKLGKYHYVCARGVKVSREMAVMIQNLLGDQGVLVLYQGETQTLPEENAAPIVLVAGVGGRKLAVIKDVLGFSKTL